MVRHTEQDDDHQVDDGDGCDGTLKLKFCDNDGSQFLKTQAELICLAKQCEFNPVGID